ncbi:MAG: phosphatase [Candidatus Saganbacteria bacterium]|nr:phosphatase [Candidatus Saganbacteria bacterium]
MAGKKDIKQIAKKFEQVGGRFLTPPEKMLKALVGIKAFVFDWDGVFHGGFKAQGHDGLYSEIDSMGLNMLRYGFWLKTKALLQLVVITGRNNATAVELSEREHFNALYQNVVDKRKAIDHFLAASGLKREQVGFVFDDINDLAMSGGAGLRIFIPREASPLLNEYMIRNKLCDYITGQGADRYALREMSELFLGLLKVYDDTVRSRVAFDQTYQKYWDIRNKIKRERVTL